MPQEIIVTLLDIDRNQVRLGFEADKRVRIHREELLRGEVPRDG